MAKKYLLYLDILGFSEMVKDESRVLDLFEIVNRLNVHRHDAFQALFFSDTLLVYNKFPTEKDEDKRYCVMFLCEFAQELLHRLVGRGYYFRALIAFGEFTHISKSNLEGFFGASLVSAYRTEKKIIGTGLFITDEANNYNEIFPTRNYMDEVRYVFLLQTIGQLDKEVDSFYPVPGEIVTSRDMDSLLYVEVQYLKATYKMMNTHHLPEVRAKHLSIWNMFCLEYPKLMMKLLVNDFNLDKIVEMDWGPAIAKLRNSALTGT